VVDTHGGKSGGSRNFEKGGGAEDNVSASSSFIANAHNELYAFYTGKGSFLRKTILSQ